MSKMKYLLSPLFLAVSGAYGATVTVNDPFCTAYSLTNGAADTMVVTCTAGTGTAPPPAPPPGPPPKTNLCAAQGFDRTIYVKWDWTASTLIGPLDTYTMLDTKGIARGLGKNGILVVEFTPTAPANTGLGTNPYPYVSSLNATGYPANSGNFNPKIAVSTTPCDMTPVDIHAFQQASSVSLTYSLGPSPTFFGNPKYLSLTPGVTYYVNVSNPVCTPDAVLNIGCESRVTLFKPTGH